MPEDTCAPRKPCLAQESQWDQPQNRHPGPGFVPQPRAWQIRNCSLSRCRPGAAGAKVSSPTPNTLTSTIIFWIRVWRHCLGSGLQLCLTLECRRKGPDGPANLAAIRDIHYAIMNRLRRPRHRVTGTAPQPVLKDRDSYCPGHWTLHRPGPNSASLIAESKPRRPAGPKNIPFPSTAAPSPHGKHIWDLRYKRPKLQLTAGRKQERLRHHHPEPGETLGDAWSHTPPARLGPHSQHAHGSSSAARTAAGTKHPAGNAGLAPAWGICPIVGAVMPPRGCP